MKSSNLAFKQTRIHQNNTITLARYAVNVNLFRDILAISLYLEYTEESKINLSLIILHLTNYLHSYRLSDRHKFQV